jgi:hypothetical protein
MFNKIVTSVVAVGLAGTLWLPAVAATTHKAAKPLPAKDPNIASAITQLEHAKKTLETDKHKDDARTIAPMRSLTS